MILGHKKTPALAEHLLQGLNDAAMKGKTCNWFLRRNRAFPLLVVPVFIPDTSPWPKSRISRSMTEAFAGHLQASVFWRPSPSGERVMLNVYRWPQVCDKWSRLAVWRNPSEIEQGPEPYND